MLGITLTTQAQKKERKEMERLSVEQQTALALKKMTLHLDLNVKQQAQIAPLLAKKMEERKNFHEKRKALKGEGKELTADQRFEIKNNMLDKQIAYKTEMKRILNDSQYEKYEKMQSKRMYKREGKRSHFKRNKQVEKI